MFEEGPQCQVLIITNSPVWVHQCAVTTQELNCGTPQLAWTQLQTKMDKTSLCNPNKVCGGREGWQGEGVVLKHKRDSKTQRLGAN